MFSSAVRWGRRAKFWNTMPILLRLRSMSSRSLIRRRSAPSISTEPELGSMSRERQRTSVDLPDPDRPITIRSSPGATSRETSLTAATTPSRSRREGSTTPSASVRRSAASRPKTL